MEALIGNDVAPLSFFDPAEDESSDEEKSQTHEGPSSFKKRAAAMKKTTSHTQPERIGRTRSETKSFTETDGVDEVFEIGQAIMATKGRKVPFWFPGKIAKVNSKGYRVDFLQVFGSEDCRQENVISVAQFETKRLTEGKTKLFKVPDKYLQTFRESYKQVIQ